MVVERLFVWGGGGASIVNVETGSNFAAIANLTGGGSKGTRDGRAGPLTAIGDDVVVFRDDGALATATPGSVIAVLGIAASSWLPFPLGPFYLMPGQFIALVGGAVNAGVGLYVEGHFPRSARRK